MNSLPRQKLYELLQEHGQELSDDLQRLEALLHISSGGHHREIFVLVAARKVSKDPGAIRVHAYPSSANAVITDLKTSTMPLDQRLARVARRLYKDLSLSEEAACWGAEAWAEAFDVGRSSAPTVHAPWKRERMRLLPPDKLTNHIASIVEQDLHHDPKRSLRPRRSTAFYRRPRRCEALLRDLYSGLGREIFALVTAQKARVVAALLAAQDDAARAARADGLRQHLQDNYALDASVAAWAVDWWAHALAQLAYAILSVLKQHEAQVHTSEFADVFWRYRDLLGAYGEFRSNDGRPFVVAMQRLVAARIRRVLVTERDPSIHAADLAMARFAYASVLTEQERRRVKLAGQRLEALAQLRRAFAKPDRAEVVRLYTQHQALLQPCRAFGLDERRRVSELVKEQLLAELQDAIVLDDLDRVEHAEREASAMGCQLIDQTESIRRARQTRAALARLQRAIGDANDQAIVHASSTHWLQGAPQVTSDQWQRVELARARLDRLPRLQRALAAGDDRAIAEIYDPVIFKKCQSLTPSEQQRCALAQRTFATFQELERAMRAKDDDLIIKIHDQYANLLDPSNLMTDSYKARIESAHRDVLALRDIHAALAGDDPLATAAAYERAIAAQTRIPDNIHPALVDIRRKAIALTAFRDALRVPDVNEETIARLGNALLSLAPELVTSDERRRIFEAIRHVGAALRADRAGGAGGPRTVGVF